MRVVILERGQLISNYDAHDGPIRVGAAANNHIHLPDAKVAPQQISLVRNGAGTWWLEINDLLRVTTVNRQIIKDRVELHQRDEIELGPFTLRIYLDITGDPTQSPAAAPNNWHRRMIDVTKSHADSMPLDTILVKHDQPLTLSRELLEQFSLLAMRLERQESVQEAMVPVLRAVLRTFSARRAWIGLRKAEHGEFNWQLCLTTQGASAARPATSEAMQRRCLIDDQYVCIPSAPHEGVGSAMGAPLRYELTHVGMLYLENDSGDPPYDAAALDQFSALACCVAMPIGDVMRRTALAKKETVNHAMTVAREVQDAVTPHALPHWDHLQLAAYRFPGAEQVCDFYDIVQLKDKTASLIVGRVTAPGAQGPRFMAEIRAAFRMSAVHGDSPAALMRVLNWLLLTGDNTRYIDAVAAHIDPNTGAVQFCVAGNRAIIGRLRDDGKCDRLECSPMPAVGQVRLTMYDISGVQLDEGDTLVLATDGVNAARSAAGEVFGLEMMHDCLCDGVGNSPGQVLHEFDEDLRDFLAGGGRCCEDVTVVLARRA